MTFLRADYFSTTLQMTTSFQVLLPDEGRLENAKVVYLLHGLSDNCTNWMRLTACERYAREHGAAVIMPEVQRGFYIDGEYSLDYFTYVSQELPKAVHRMFSLSLQREKNYVMGLSMGGFGALKCALTNPRRYAGCGSFSGVTNLNATSRREGGLRPWEYDALLGIGKQAGRENDLFALARKKDLPRIYLSCGEQDALYPMNVEFAGHLEKIGADYRFDHRPGNHTWDFWDKSLCDCMQWLLKP